jgi:hypothetical protein
MQGFADRSEARAKMAKSRFLQLAIKVGLFKKLQPISMGV